jgi:predicted transcriptional regulator
VLTLPQAERSHNQVEMLKYLRTQENGATAAALKAYTRNEITLLGATDKTIENYIDNLKNAGLIEYTHPFWKITKAGLIFLERLGA